MGTHRIERALTKTTEGLGSLVAVAAAGVVIAAWVVGLGFVPGGILNPTYQLVINTFTTIVTFWMVFVIQNTTNREDRATQTKLDAVLEALHCFAVQGGVELPDDVLRLLGLEEEPAADIKREQERVRDQT